MNDREILSTLKERERELQVQLNKVQAAIQAFTQEKNRRKKKSIIKK